MRDNYFKTMGILNFSTDKLITGVNVIDGNLYWTDDNSEPKKLEIDRFRGYNHQNNQTTIETSNVIESDISVIRLHPWEALSLELTEYTPTATQPEPPFEMIFPRFSYRWKYQDGQFSPYAPFTQAAFIPKSRRLTATGTRGEENFEPTTEEENYVEGFNTTMFNNVGTIALNNIPRGPRDVVSVQLLYTESISTTVYILEELEIPLAQRGLDYVISSRYTGGPPVEPIYDQDGNLTNGASVSYDLLPLRYQLSARKIFRALPANELSRPYDTVPQIAKAQEITANRLIFGNYRFGPSSVPGMPDSFYTQPTVVSMDTEVVSAGTGDGLHVKGTRTYEVAIAYLDAYGRQGPLIQVGSITNDDGTVDEQVPIQTDFAQSGRQQLQVTMRSDPPAWADRYRYFVKDPAMDHHNLISYNIYNDGTVNENLSPYIWVEYLSTDRNKVQEGTIVSPRRVNEVVSAEKTRHLIQEIQGEAPDVVRAQLSTSGNLSGRIIGSLAHPSANISNGFNNDRSNAVPANGTAVWYFRDERIDFSQSGLLRYINQYIGDQSIDIDEGGTTETRFEVDRDGSGTRVNQIAMLDGDNVDSFLYMRFIQRGSDRPMTNWMQVTQLNFGPESDNSPPHRVVFQITAGDNVAIQGTRGTDDGITGIVPVDATGMESDTPATGFNIIGGFTRNVGGRNGFNSGGGSNSNWEVEFATSEISEEALERLSGRFWAKVPRSGLETARSEFDNNGDLRNLHQVWFETEPDVEQSQLDLFWETSDTFCVCTEHGWPNKIEWYNSVAEVTTGGVYLETTRINDRFNTVQLVKGVKANIPTERSSLEERPYGMIWSGIYNSRTSANRLNSFIEADGITKELEPNYGTIQKMYTRDTNVLAFTEDKVFRILADKDQLFNADGGGNVSASNAVLGQTTPFPGEYGISKNPESFAFYGNNIYFSDANRGVMCQLTPGNGQIFEISGAGMNDTFRDRLFSADNIVGMFDNYSDKYIVSIQGYDSADAIIDTNGRFPEELDDQGTPLTSSDLTLGYEGDVQGWSSRMSYIPESGQTLNNKFYTWRNGRLWMHNSSTSSYNNFYNTQYESEIEVIFNDSPSSVKEFLTLGLEGTTGWELISIETDQDSATLLGDFVVREGKQFQSIVIEEPVYVFDSSMPNNVRPTSDTQLKGGAKGFYCKVRLKTTDAASSTFQELFAINSEAVHSSN